MSPDGKLRSLLASARTPNLPSIVSNVWVGVAIAVIFAADRNAALGEYFWHRTGSAVLVGGLLYLAGNFFNDYYDRNWDRTHRPERALPRSLFSASTYLTIAAACSLAALVIAFVLGATAGLTASSILFFILIYTVWHKQAAWAVIPMGLCRASLPLLGFFSAGLIAADGAAATAGWLLCGQAGALLLYIAGLSLSARYESMSQPPAAARMLSRLMLVGSGLAVALAWTFLSPWEAWRGLVPFAFWLLLCLTLFRRPTPAHVSALLAGIPLIDWIGLASFSVQTGQASSLFHATCLLLPPACFAAGRALQRLVSAT